MVNIYSSVLNKEYILIHHCEQNHLRSDIFTISHTMQHHPYFHNLSRKSVKNVLIDINICTIEKLKNKQQ